VTSREEGSSCMHEVREKLASFAVTRNFD